MQLWIAHMTDCDITGAYSSLEKAIEGIDRHDRENDDDLTDELYPGFNTVRKREKRLMNGTVSEWWEYRGRDIYVVELDDGPAAE